MNILKALLFGALCGTGFAQKAQPMEHDTYDDDVRLLASVLKTYSVEKRSPQEALKELCEQALSKNHWVDFRIRPEDSNVAHAQISLNLHDVPATQVLIYIAELSGCRFKLWGWPAAPVIEFQPISGIDDTTLFYHTQSFECTKEGADRLGLRPDMSNAEVQKLLVKYGVEFPEDAVAFWNGKTLRLAIRNRPAENAVVSGIVRMANKGFEFVRTPAKKDAHKKQE